VEAIDLSAYNTIIDKIAQDLHGGKSTPKDINQDLINQTFSDLNDGAAKGFGATFSTFGKDAGKDTAVLQIQQNIYRFSHAKSVAELEEFNKALYNGDQIRPFNDFKTEVEKLNAKYNKSYLETEYNTARNAAEHARKWQEYQTDKDLFPNLKYMTVGDGRVREEHAALQGVVKPLDDPFWSMYYPPNGWNCRCYTVQTAEKIDKGKIEDKTVPQQFLGNVGKDNVIFSKDQTFFQIAKAVGTNETNQAFELSKINVPLIKAYKSNKTGARVNVSPWTDTRQDELFGNYRMAITLTDKKSLNIDLVAHINGKVILGKKSPEYRIDGKIGDRKTPKSLDYTKTLKAANEQGCEVVVYDLSKNNDTVENALATITDLLSKKTSDKKPVHENIKEIYIVSGDKKTIKYFKREKAS
jgi:SPP1 gp7 family putative phage head morphogenesis protein